MSNQDVLNQSTTFLAADLAQLTAVLIGLDGGDIAAPDARIGTPFSTMSQDNWRQAVHWWNRSGRGLIGQLAERACPACGAEEGRRALFESYDGYTYVECARCGCWHVPLAVDASLFERFFEACPEAADLCLRSYATRLTAEHQAADLARFDDYLQRLSPLLAGRTGLRYLDIGCGLGKSLVAAQARGFTASGIETSRESIQICREAGLDVHHAEEPLPAPGYDLVSFWESLEHMADPAAQLAMCDTLLAEQGLLVFTIPNLDSPLLRLQRGDCSVVHGGYDTPGHINLFGPAQVRLLLERCGFSALHIDGQYSMSLPELVSYMQGIHRGAADLLDAREPDRVLPPQARAILNSIGPSVAMLERLTLTAPILFVVACRTRDVAAFESASKALAVRSDLSIQARQGMTGISIEEAGGLRDQINHLQAEVNKRDALLAATQAEVNLRDKLLARQADEIDTLRQHHAADKQDGSDSPFIRLLKGLFGK